MAGKPSNRFALWMVHHGVGFSEFGRRVGKRVNRDKSPIAAATVERWSLERDHPRRRIPAEKFMGPIYEETGREISPNDFYGIPQERAA